MRASERKRRNATMAARKADGATYAQIAKEFGVARSTVQKAIADHANEAPTVMLVAGRRPGDLDVAAVFVRIVRGHAAVLDRMERLVDEANSDLARIGAARTVLTAGEGLLKILGLVGLMPNPDQVLVARVLRRQARADARERGEELLVGSGS
jgi:hypothetical protein